MKKRTICAALLLAMLTALPAAAQQEGLRAAPTARIENGSLPVLDTTPKLDVEVATSGYLARVQGDARKRSDDYAEGGAWLTLFHLIYGTAIAGVLMGLGLSARLRDWAEERTHSRTYQAMIYGAIMVTAVALLSLPLALYECHLREQAYGLSNLSLARWAGDFGLVFLMALAVTVLCLPIFYAIIRAARETWWVWSGGLAILFLIVQLVIAPVFIAPLFNDHAPLLDGPLKTKIAALAAANQFSADDINVSDASRQSNRISAHVSGFLGTARITLSDNLLRNSSEDEVLAVVGHEIGHYVMGHTTRAILLQGLLMLLGFGFAAWVFPIAADFFGGIWQVRRVDDIASLPALAALLGLFAFLVMPVSHYISRTDEHQADLYGLNAMRKPDAFATLLLKLAPHRKLEPGNLEEAVFYRHPSARSQIETAMAWKAHHIADPDIREMAGPGVIAP